MSMEAGKILCHYLVDTLFFIFAIGAVGIQERKEEKPGYMMKGMFSADAENIAC